MPVLRVAAGVLVVTLALVGGLLLLDGSRRKQHAMQALQAQLEERMAIEEARWQVELEATDVRLAAFTADGSGLAPETTASTPAEAVPDAPIETREYPTPEASVVLSEIHYHPRGGDRRDEWIELVNRSRRAVDASGWKLASGVTFTLPPETRLEPGAFLVIAAGRARATRLAPSAAWIGDWTGSLADGGETIRLETASGALVDELEYNDRGRFSVLADGLGRSLERRSPHLDTSLAGNWGASGGRAGGWSRQVAMGVATAQTLYVYLGGVGSAYVDDLVLTPVDADGRSTGPPIEETFERDRGGWSFIANHGRSTVSTRAAHGGKRALQVVATGAGSGRAAAAAWAVPGLEVGGGYRLELWALLPEGSPPVTSRFSSGGTGVPGLSVTFSRETGGATPGRRNTVHSDSPPPFVHPVRHTPETPRPGDEIAIEARVWSATSLAAVTLWYDDGRGEQSVALEPRPPAAASTGAASGAAPATAAHTARIGPFAAGAIVRYRVEARDADGATGSYPFAGEPVRARAFRVSSPAAPGPFPLYELFVDASELQALEQNPYADTYRRATLVQGGRVWTDIGVRYRGHTSRGLWKHHWKVKLPKGDPFVTPRGDRVGVFNLNACSGDKTFLREKLSYDLWRDLGEAASDAWHVRVHLNGAYLGFYLHLENPNEDFLEHHGLEEGWLWKAYDDGSGTHGFQLNAGDPATARAVLGEALNDLRSRSGADLDAAVRRTLNVDSYINYLAACQVTHSGDHVRKNYLVHAGPDRKLSVYPWDMDLTHGRNFECRGGGVWNDVIRHDLWDAEHNDRELLYGTEIHPKCDAGGNALIDAVIGRTRTFRPAYYQRLADLLAHHYHPDILVPRIERWRGRLRDSVLEDQAKWGTYGEPGFDNHVDVLVGWVRKRFDYLRKRLGALGVTVGPPLEADFEADGVAGEAPLEVRFRALGAGRIEAHEWTFGDGARSAETDPRHVYDKPGRYDVALRVSGPDGTHEVVRKKLVWSRGKKSAPAGD